ncbi:MAG TPA: hypothetical protein VHL57_04335 [Flavobacteriales bacterium]|jgi:predicted metal-dependent HD superfamily phosphohydrolase|nr:hypothetical protein [Flavobacteriales bacterium]
MLGPFAEAFHIVLLEHDVPSSDGERLWQELEKAHTANGRHYHTLQHLEHLHAALVGVAHLCADRHALVLATAYHDAVYDILRKDNEERSAQLLQKRLQPFGVSPALIDRAVAHIHATKAHAASTDPDTDLFTDADLSILGAAPADYDHYTEQVRREYRYYPDLLYNPGRRKVLEHFLAMPVIFKTAAFRERLEAQARANLRRELHGYSN